MKRHIRVIFFAVMLFAMNGFAQTQVCASGTLANVMGTSCTIGQITFTFGTSFNGFFQTTDLQTNVISTRFFGPDTIAFVPIVADNQSGFQLITNFDSNTNGTGLFFSDNVASFSYGVQANATSEIVSETATISGSVTQLFNDNIGAFDEHLFRNQSFLQLGPTAGFNQFSGSFSKLSDSATLATPGITADPNDPSGLGFTTLVSATAFSGDHANLISANFLYTTAPRVPTPPAGSFQFQNIDLPGAVSTFADGINDLGQLVGSFQDSLGNLHGYVGNGADFQTIDFPNASGTFPTSINNSGTVAGAYADEFGQGHGFVLENGTFTSVDFPEAIFTSVLQINERGDLAGVYLLPRRAGGGVHGFIRDQNGFTTLDDPNNTFFIPFTQAFGVNNREEAIGTYLDVNNNNHGFSFFNGVFQDIAVPGAATTSPEGLNDGNSMVGIYTDLDGVQHGYLKQGALFSTLDFPGSIGTTIPFQINDRGTMVGSYIDDQGLPHSFTAELQPGAQAQINSQRTEPVHTAPVQPCSPADWVRHPETIRNPHLCHFVQP